MMRKGPFTYDEAKMMRRCFCKLGYVWIYPRNCLDLVQFEVPPWRWLNILKQVQFKEVSLYETQKTSLTLLFDPLDCDRPTAVVKGISCYIPRYPHQCPKWRAHCRPGALGLHERSATDNPTSKPCACRVCFATGGIDGPSGLVARRGWLMIDDDCRNPHYDMDTEPIYTCYIIHIIINICRFGQMFIYSTMPLLA